MSSFYKIPWYMEAIDKLARPRVYRCVAISF